MVSFPDPHHPFCPPGKYWDMYKPEDMPIPEAYQRTDWDMPEYVKIMKRQREENPKIGEASGVSIAISQREAQEARALTCGMITMIDDAVGQIRNAARHTVLGDNIVQIFTSDHGDHLGDHQLLFKGTEQYDSLNHVLFIWADPKGKGRRTAQNWRRPMILAQRFWNMQKSSNLWGCRVEFYLLLAGKGEMPRISSLKPRSPTKPLVTVLKCPASLPRNGVCLSILANVKTAV